MTVRKSIAVVDANASMRQAMERLFRAAGWDVFVFSTAAAFLESDAPRLADAFIVDTDMEDVSGFDLCAQIVSKGISAPVIVVTAKDRAGALERAMSAGAAAYFAKPFEWRSLMRVLSPGRP